MIHDFVRFANSGFDLNDVSNWESISSACTVVRMKNGDTVELLDESHLAFVYFMENSNGMFRNLSKNYEAWRKERAA